MFANRKTRWRSCLLAVFTLLCTSLSVVGAAKAAHASTGPACVDDGVEVLFARGSGEHVNDTRANAFYWALIGSDQNPGLLKTAGVNTSWAELGNLDNNYKVDPVSEYPAVPVDSWSVVNVPDGVYANSVGVGADEFVNYLNARVIQCPTETEVIGAFSQGSDLIGWSLARDGSDGHVALSSTAKSHIAYAALYGDPKFNPGSPYDRASGIAPWWVRGDGIGYGRGLEGAPTKRDGILGARNPYVLASFQGRFGSWCDKGDDICNGAPTTTGGTHTTAYQGSDGWIVKSAQEITNAALTKVAELNPVPPVPGPYHRDQTVATAAYAAKGEQYVFWKGSDGYLHEGWYANGVWNGPISFPQFGILYSSPTVAVNPLNGDQHVFWRSGGGNLMQGWWDGSWHGPQDIGPFNMASAPTEAAFGNEVDVFWRGQDNNLWEKWWNGTTWLGPVNIGMGPLDSAPSAGANSNGEQYVFWRGTNGLLTAAWYTGGSWHGPGILSNMGFIGSAPTVNVRTFNGEQDVFWKGMDTQLWEAHYINGVWHGPVCLCWMGQQGSPPAATAWGTDVDVFWVDVNSGNLMQGYYQNNVWHGPGSRGMGLIPIQG